MFRPEEFYLGGSFSRSEKQLSARQKQGQSHQLVTASWNEIWNHFRGSFLAIIILCYYLCEKQHRNKPQISLDRSRKRARAFL